MDIKARKGALVLAGTLALVYFDRLHRGEIVLLSITVAALLLYGFSGWIIRRNLSVAERLGRAAILLMVCSASVFLYAWHFWPETTTMDHVDVSVQRGGGPQITPVIPKEEERPKQEQPPKTRVKQAPKKLAEVQMAFFMSGAPKELSIAFVNRSDFLVRDIRWAIILWNKRLDQAASLPIYTYPIDWIKGNDVSGHMAVFQQNPPPQVTNGDELIGVAGVDCPTCTPRSYVLDVIWGDHGWYGESKTQSNGKLDMPAQGTAFSEARAAFFRQVVSLVPQENRIEMTDH
jgi:hypothetical protein